MHSPQHSVNPAAGGNTFAMLGQPNPASYTGLPYDFKQYNMYSAQVHKSPECFIFHIQYFIIFYLLLAESTRIHGYKNPKFP